MQSPSLKHSFRSHVHYMSNLQKILVLLGASVWLLPANGTSRSVVFASDAHYKNKFSSQLLFIFRFLCLKFCTTITFLSEHVVQKLFAHNLITIELANVHLHDEKEERRAYSAKIRLMELNRCNPLIFAIFERFQVNWSIVYPSPKSIRGVLVA